MEGFASSPTTAMRHRKAGGPMTPVSSNGNSTKDDVFSSQSPNSLRDALKAANRKIDGFGTPSESPSEEDYDDISVASVKRTAKRRPSSSAAPLKGRQKPDANVFDSDTTYHQESVSLSETSSAEQLPTLATARIRAREDLNAYVLDADDKELKEIIKRGLEKVCLIS
jgi:sterol O-acyltransferase